MQTAWFSKPVVVSVGVTGSTRNLSNTQQASRHIGATQAA